MSTKGKFSLSGPFVKAQYICHYVYVDFVFVLAHLVIFSYHVT